MCDATGPESGTVGEVVGSMLGVEAPFDAGTGLPAEPVWDEGTLDPKEVHAYLCALARDDAARDHVRGQWLLRGLAARVWEPLGMGSFFEYVERVFGYRPHATAERLRVAEALRELERLSEALRAGRVNFSAIKEVTRVAVPANEAAWLEKIEGRTVREVERMVRGKQRGDGPDDPPDPQPERSLLRFEVNPETRALLDEARTVLTRDAGHHLTDDEVLQLMAASVLHGGRNEDATPADLGQSTYQIHMTVCEKCNAGDIHAGGEEHRVGPEVVEAAGCDASVVSVPRGTDPQAGRASQTIPPATRRAVVQRDKGRCSVPGCRHHNFLHAHHIDFRSEGGDHRLDNLTLLCSVHHHAVHDGRLLIRGTPSQGLTFLHADGSGYGASGYVVEPRKGLAQRSTVKSQTSRSAGRPGTKISRRSWSAVSRASVE